MMNKRPRDFANLAALSYSVATSWKNNYSSYFTKFITYDELIALATSFMEKTLENAQLDITKKGNTADLRTANLAIERAVKVLRNYIKGEYIHDKNLSVYYASYGLEANERNTYYLIKDNDRRRQRISILISKLSEPNNPFANKELGLAHWQTLQTQHATAWENSKLMKVQKAALSRETAKSFQEIDDLLRKLQAQIKIDFPKSDHDKVLREFGFLKEVYK